MEAEELDFARKCCCCSAAQFGLSLAEDTALCSPEYVSALRDLLNLSDEAWASREYALANSGYEKPCPLPRPCKLCILNRHSFYHTRCTP